jgi:hypothetical protein
MAAVSPRSFRADANVSVSSRSESSVNVSTTSRSTTATRENTSRTLIRQDKSRSVTLANVAASPSQKKTSHHLEYADELRHEASATFPSLPSGSLAQSNQLATEVQSSAVANSTTLRPLVYFNKLRTSSAQAPHKLRTSSAQAPHKLRTSTSANFASLHTAGWSQPVPTSYSMPSHL